MNIFQPIIATTCIPSPVMRNASCGRRGSVLGSSRDQAKIVENTTGPKALDSDAIVIPNPFSSPRLVVSTELLIATAVLTNTWARWRRRGECVVFTVKRGWRG